MSVTDPLIKDIKGHLLRLFQESKAQKITDSSQNLHDFCDVLEKIYYIGLIQHHNIFNGNKRPDAYSWMCSLPVEGPDLADFKYKTSVEEVQRNKIVKSPLGKFRLLTRHCLMRQCLHFPLELLMSTGRIRNFYERNSIIGDEILAEIFLSVLLQCNKISFQLQLSSAYFLDTTWKIPDLLILELVPCNNLGISISFSENKAVIVHITPNSVASECSEITTGDVLANLNGVEINSSCKGRLNSILQLSRGRPVSVTIIKAFHKKSDDIFQPMKAILRNLQIDLVKISQSGVVRSQGSVTREGEVPAARSRKVGYQGEYVGSVSVESRGNVRHIEEAIRRCLNNANSAKRSVTFEIGEMNVKVTDVRSNEVVLRHSYMQISSCGSAATLPNYIAYMAGDENCDTANSFICYVFRVKDAEDAYIILQSIGQGFYRTHFAV